MKLEENEAAHLEKVEVFKSKIIATDQLLQHLDKKKKNFGTAIESLKKMKKQNNTLSEQCSEYESKLQIVIKELDQLRTENENLKKDFKIKDKKNNELQNSVSSLEQSLMQFQSLNKLKEGEKQKIADFKRDLTKKEKECMKLTGENERLTADVQTQDIEIKKRDKFHKKTLKMLVSFAKELESRGALQNRKRAALIRYQKEYTEELRLSDTEDFNFNDASDNPCVDINENKVEEIFHNDEIPKTKCETSILPCSAKTDASTQTSVSTHHSSVLKHIASVDHKSTSPIHFPTSPHQSHDIANHMRKGSDHKSVNGTLNSWEEKDVNKNANVNTFKTKCDEGEKCCVSLPISNSRSISKMNMNQSVETKYNNLCTLHEKKSKLCLNGLENAQLTESNSSVDDTDYEFKQGSILANKKFSIGINNECHTYEGSETSTDSFDTIFAKMKSQICLKKDMLSPLSPLPPTPPPSHRLAHVNSVVPSVARMSSDGCINPVTDNKVYSSVSRNQLQNCRTFFHQPSQGFEVNLESSLGNSSNSRKKKSSNIPEQDTYIPFIPKVNKSNFLSTTSKSSFSPHKDLKSDSERFHTRIQYDCNAKANDIDFKGSKNLVINMTALANGTIKFHLENDSDSHLSETFSSSNSAFSSPHSKKIVVLPSKTTTDNFEEVTTEEHHNKFQTKQRHAENKSKAKKKLFLSKKQKRFGLFVDNLNDRKNTCGREMEIEQVAPINSISSVPVQHTSDLFGNNLNDKKKAFGSEMEIDQVGLVNSISNTPALNLQENFELDNMMSECNGDLTPEMTSNKNVSLGMLVTDSINQVMPECQISVNVLPESFKCNGLEESREENDKCDNLINSYKNSKYKESESAFCEESKFVAASSALSEEFKNDPKCSFPENPKCNSKGTFSENLKYCNVQNPLAVLKSSTCNNPDVTCENSKFCGLGRAFTESSECALSESCKCVDVDIPNISECDSSGISLFEKFKYDSHDDILSGSSKYNNQAVMLYDAKCDISGDTVIENTKCESSEHLLTENSKSEVKSNISENVLADSSKGELTKLPLNESYQNDVNGVENIACNYRLNNGVNMNQSAIDKNKCAINMFQSDHVKTMDKINNVEQIEEITYQIHSGIENDPLTSLLTDTKDKAESNCNLDNKSAAVPKQADCSAEDGSVSVKADFFNDPLNSGTCENDVISDMSLNLCHSRKRNIFISPEKDDTFLLTDTEDKAEKNCNLDKNATVHKQANCSTENVSISVKADFPVLLENPLNGGTSENYVISDMSLNSHSCHGKRKRNISISSEKGDLCSKQEDVLEKCKKAKKVELVKYEDVFSPLRKSFYFQVGKCEKLKSICRLTNILKKSELAHKSVTQDEDFFRNFSNNFLNPMIVPHADCGISTVLHFLGTSEIDLSDLFVSSTNTSIPLVTSLERDLVEILFQAVTKQEKTFKNLISGFLDMILAQIAYNKVIGIFGLASLCRVYTLVCHKLNEPNIPRVMCWDLLTKRSQFKHYLLASVCGVWPEVLHFKSHGKAIENPLGLVFSFVLFRKPSELSKEANVQRSKSLLLALGNFPSCVCDSSSGLLKLLFHGLFQEDNDDLLTASSAFEYEKAVELLSILEAWEWAYDEVIVKQIYPFLNTWVSNLSQSKKSTCFAAIAIFHISVFVCQMCPKIHFELVHFVMKSLREFLLLSSQTAPFAVQEAAFDSLLKLQSYGIEHVIPVLESWYLKNEHILSPVTKSLVESVPVISDEIHKISESKGLMHT